MQMATCFAVLTFPVINFLHTFLSTLFFPPEGMGSVYITFVKIPEGWEGVISVFTKCKFQGGGGGGLHEIPSMVGISIFSGTTH